MASRICCLLFSSDNINFSHASSDNDACGVQILRKSCNTVVFSFADCSELKGDSAYTMPGIAKKVKTTVLQDLRKICTPQASLSDEAWEKLMLSDENNKQHIREAIVAMERNNQSNYWEALGKVECPDM